MILKSLELYIAKSNGLQNAQFFLLRVIKTRSILSLTPCNHCSNCLCSRRQQYRYYQFTYSLKSRNIFNKLKKFNQV